MASTSERSKSAARKADVSVSNEPKETNSIVFEWPLRGLKMMFDSSKVDAKSKVIKSTPFGGGRWTVLFYAQSGHEQNCSLYLNAEPLPHERMHPLLATAIPSSDFANRDSIHASNGAKGKGDNGLEEKWQRKGLFRFTFNIQTIEDRSILGTKEAHDHAFSHKTSNWGWAQFAKRDHVYYKNPEVVREDGFLITVTITSSPEKPKIADPVSHIVPPVLVQAMGSLLDDPEHSDVVFLLHPSRRRSKAGRPELRKVYAIRKILAARSEYFRLMFEGGFQEAEAEESSEGEADALTKSSISHNAPAHPSRAHHSAARASEATRLYEDAGVDATYSLDEDEDGQETFFEDSDEDFDDFDDVQAGSPYSIQTPADSHQRVNIDSDQNSPNEDGGGDVYNADLSDEEDETAVSRSGRQNVIRSPERQYAQEAKDESAEEGIVEALERSYPARITTGTNSPALPASASKHENDRSAAESTESFHNMHASTSTSTHSKTKRMQSAEAGTSSSRVAPISRVRSSAERRDRRKRRKVNVLDSAYPTFKALLFFLYTDTVEFAPLTSSFLPADIGSIDSSSSSIGLLPGRRAPNALGSIGAEMAAAHRKRKQVIEAYRDRNPEKPCPCSAKAMYRLADKLDIPDLKRRAQEHIQVSLTVHNIVWEVFSGFNTQYPDIRKMETDFLLKHWPQVKRSNAMKSIFLRSSAHPGLAEVWPHLLEYLEYRQPEVDESEDVVSY